MARRLVEKLPNDIKADIIKEKKNDEPPPPPPPPPDMPVTPPPFIPPVEVTVAPMIEEHPPLSNASNEKPTFTPPAVPNPDVIVKPRQDPKHPFGNIDDYYPAAAKRGDGQEGLVVISVTIGVDGRSSDVKVVTSSGFPLLDEAAVKFGSTVRMLPATKNGAPFPYTVNLPIRFRLKNT
ncbi:MAG: energy transducer TonB [Solimonas sp.]